MAKRIELAQRVIYRGERLGTEKNLNPLTLTLKTKYLNTDGQTNVLAVLVARSMNQRMIQSTYK